MSETTQVCRDEMLALAPVVDGLVGDLRSDHAGETGAVMIYRGILAGCGDPAVRAFASAHMATEQGHLELLEGILVPAERSVLLPIWRVAGWLTGFLPSLFGAQAVFATIDAVETFVDHHYEEQIVKLPNGALRAALVKCQADEVHHRDEARDLTEAPPGWLMRAWVWMVGAGSKAAVSAARWV
jgi:ubiquinone biosynthesis monooxygenase Coq7